MDTSGSVNQTPGNLGKIEYSNTGFDQDWRSG